MSVDAAPLTTSSSTFGERRRPARSDRRRLLWALPAFVFMAVFFLYPLGLLLDTSLRDVSLGSAARPDNAFVGTLNYRELFADPAFVDAVPRTALYLAGTVLLQLSLGLILAMTLNERLPGVAVPRFLVFFIWLLPPVVSGAVWKFALEGTANGLVNDALLDLGVVESPIVFLSDPTIAMMVIGLVNTWAGVPFVAIVLMSALKDTPLELYDAARVDGASAARRFWHVTLPAISPTLAVLSALLLIYSFKAFDFIFVLTGGGPGTATSTVPFLAYHYSFDQFDFGVGSAAGVISVVAALIFAIPYVWHAGKELRDGR